MLVRKVHSTLLCIYSNRTIIVIMNFFGQVDILMLLRLHIVVIVKKLANLNIILFFDDEHHALQR